MGKDVFEIWINEDEPPEPGTKDSWDLCLDAVRTADLVLVLYNGNAGWARSSGDIGICHAELMTALAESPGKVSLISLIPTDDRLKPASDRDKLFQSYVDQVNLFRGSTIATPDDVLSEAKRAIREAVVSLTSQGAREVKKSRFNTGPALDWSRLDFLQRQAIMKRVVIDALVARGKDVADGALVTVAGKKVLFVAHAIPAAMNVSSARELVGQPFLKDHVMAPVLKRSLAGPVHVIACHRSVSEGQARALLGFPDATIVSGAFGVYVSDNIQKMQICLIANCRDESSTRHGVQRLFEWLNQTGEDVLLAKRALSRSRIVGAIAKEV